MGQLLIGRQQGGLDDLVDGEAPGRRGDSLRRDGDVAELPGEVGGTEAAILLHTDAPVLAEQRTQNCGGHKQVGFWRELADPPGY